MGYLFLAIALLCGSTKGYCGKKTSGYTQGLPDAMLANILRMGFCILIGLLVVLIGGYAAQLVPTMPLMLVCALSGVSTAVFVVTWLLCVKKSAYMMLDVFLMLGVLIPIIAGNLLFHEQIRASQWIGICILFFAVLIMCSYNNSIKKKLRLSSLLLLMLCGIANGITDFSQKLFVRNLPQISASVFNLYTYIFAGISLLLTVSFIPKSNERSTGDIKKIMLYILVMAVCLFANSLFKTLSAEYLDSVLLYPLNQGAALILSTLMAAVFFRERITAKAIVGIAIAFIGLIFINLL